jgi:hypothetical protein
MIVIPSQSQCKNCMHYLGVSQPDGTEMSEKVICRAFPGGVPSMVLVNKVDHRKPIEGDNGLLWTPIHNEKHPIDLAD